MGKNSQREMARETLEQTEIFNFSYLLYCPALEPFELSLNRLVLLWSIVLRGVEGSDAFNVG